MVVGGGRPIRRLAAALGLVLTVAAAGCTDDSAWVDPGTRGRPDGRPGAPDPASGQVAAVDGSDTLDDPVFLEGVSAGAARRDSVLLWTRAVTDAPVSVAVRTDGFGADCTEDGTGATFADSAGIPDPLRDRTVRVRVEGLEPGTWYSYRFCDHRGTASRTGSFRTAPAADDATPVVFAVTGDATAERASGAEEPFYAEGFDVYSAAASLPLDFIANGGDTIYADDVVKRSGGFVARTRPEKWVKYRENLAQPQLRAARASTSTYSYWDDHEWDNGFSRNPDDPATEEHFRAGVDAFTDYTPVDHSPETGIFAVYPWGPNLDVVVLDETTFRTPPVDSLFDAGRAEACRNPVTKKIERVPTAPQELRNRWADLLGDQWLRAPVDPGCRALLDDPQRHILGPDQFAALDRALRSSTAAFRVVLSTNPTQEFYVAPYGRFEGYPAERARLVELLSSVPGTVVLATDVHATLAGPVDLEPGRPAAPGTATEVAVGPAAAGQRQDIWSRYFAQDEEAVDRLATEFLLAPADRGGLGMDCVRLDAYAFATVTAGPDRLEVQPRDRTGAPIVNVDGTPCGPVVVLRP